MLLQILEGAARPLQTSPQLNVHRSSCNGTSSTRRRLVPARPQHLNLSRTPSLRCHAKKSPSSAKGRRNDDEELARQAMRAMEALGGSSPRTSRPHVTRRRGGDARVAGMDAAYLASKASKQSTLAEALDAIEAATSPSASATAQMLYHLGTALTKERPRMQEGRVASAMAKLTALMLEEHRGSSTGNISTPRIQQLEGKEINLSAWALSKVQHIRGTDVTQLALALTEQALHGSAMDGEGWRNWSGLLFGLAKAGMSCQSNLEVQQLFTLAVTQRLPELLTQGQECSAQSVSNTLLACFQAGYKGELQLLVSALASPAGVRTLYADDAKPQAISNVVWALAALKFYDVELFSAASSALLEKYEWCNSHDLSNLFYGCAEVQHWDSNMERLARLIGMQCEEQLGRWNGQDIANALHSWALLTTVGVAPASPGFTNMAQQLFSHVARMGGSALNEAQLSQLFLAHQVAVHVGLPGGGLSADQLLLQACHRSYEAQQLGLQKQVRRSATLELEIAAVMQHAGFDVKRAVVIGGKFVQLLAQDVAVRVTMADDYFQAPPGLLKGGIPFHSVLTSRLCKGSIVIGEPEWASLKGDLEQQKAFVVQRLQQALDLV